MADDPIPLEDLPGTWEERACGAENVSARGAFETHAKLLRLGLDSDSTCTAEEALNGMKRARAFEHDEAGQEALRVMIEELEAALDATEEAVTA